MRSKKHTMKGTMTRMGTMFLDMSLPTELKYHAWYHKHRNTTITRLNLLHISNMIKHQNVMVAVL